MFSSNQCMLYEEAINACLNAQMVHPNFFCLQKNAKISLQREYTTATLL